MRFSRPVLGRGVRFSAARRPDLLHGSVLALKKYAVRLPALFFKRMLERIRVARPQTSAKSA
jgi:hypothetical protein